MNRLSCRNALLSAFITCIVHIEPATAQQVTIYGKFDFGACSITGINGTTVAAKGNATLVTSHADGLAGNIPASVTCSLDSGINYSFNAATLTPFPVQANAAIWAGKLTVNAAISINKQVYVADTLALNAGNLTIPSADSLVITSGYAIAGYPFNSTKHIVTAVDTSSNTQGWLIVKNVDGPYLFPVGTTSYYLPATLDPSASGTYAVRAFEDITVNGTPGGTAFTAAQKATVADAVWNIARRTNDTSTCHITLQWPQALEGNDFSEADHIGISLFDSTWKAPAGNGDNTINTATICTGLLTAFYVGQKGKKGQKHEVDDTSKILDAMSKSYPNPVNDQITIEHAFEGKITVTVYDLLGRMLIREYYNSPKVVLHTGTLTTGVYILQVSNGIHTTTRKFIKE